MWWGHELVNSSIAAVLATIDRSPINVPGRVEHNSPDRIRAVIFGVAIEGIENLPSPFLSRTQLVNHSEAHF